MGVELPPLHLHRTNQINQLVVDLHRHQDHLRLPLHQYRPHRLQQRDHLLLYLLQYLHRQQRRLNLLRLSRRSL